MGIQSVAWGSTKSFSGRINRRSGLYQGAGVLCHCFSYCGYRFLEHSGESLCGYCFHHSGCSGVYSCCWERHRVSSLGCRGDSPWQFLSRAVSARLFSMPAMVSQAYGTENAVQKNRDFTIAQPDQHICRAESRRYRRNDYGTCHDDSVGYFRSRFLAADIENGYQHNPKLFASSVASGNFWGNPGEIMSYKCAGMYTFSSFRPFCKW